MATLTDAIAPEQFEDHAPSRRWLLCGSSDQHRLGFRLRAIQSMPPSGEEHDPDNHPPLIDIVLIGPTQANMQQAPIQ